jgi:hypothetical protein
MGRTFEGMTISILASICCWCLEPGLPSAYGFRLRPTFADKRMPTPLDHACGSNHLHLHGAAATLYMMRRLAAAVMVTNLGGSAWVRVVEKCMVSSEF